MRNLILVAFVEPVAVGLEFPRGDWPLHITLLRFDIPDAQAPADAQGSSDADSPDGTEGAADAVDVVDKVALLAGPEAAAALGTKLAVGADAGFGHNGAVTVSVVEPNPGLQRLHEQLLDAVESQGGRVATPHYAREFYRPHISHHNGKRLQPGDILILDRIALVDMAPDGDHSIRRVLKLWDLPASQ